MLVLSLTRLKAVLGADFGDMVEAHYEDMLRFYGAPLGARVARKHLGWYMEVAGTPNALRRAVLTEADPESVKRHIRVALGDAQTSEVAA